jgi:hypothetical protein
MAPEHRAMNTRIYEGIKQACGDGRWLQCRPIRGADSCHAKRATSQALPGHRSLPI